jgi:hypothetical protein
MKNENEYIKMLFEKYQTMMLDKKQACEQIGISVSLMNKLIHENKKCALPKFKRIGNKYLFSLKSIFDYLESDLPEG